MATSKPRVFSISAGAIKKLLPEGSGDTECGLCALVSGSHGKGYYTTAASLFAPAPGARHDPRADVLCRLGWSLEVTKYQVYYIFFSAQSAGLPAFPRVKSCKVKMWLAGYIYHALARDVRGGWFGFACCLWPCEDPTLAVCYRACIQTPTDLWGCQRKTVPHGLSNPLGAYAEVTARQRERVGDYVKVG